MRRELLDCEVGRIELRRGGSGPPLVYLHSASGEGEGLEFLDLLSDRAEVLAPMFPGFGSSEGIEAIDDIEDAAFHLLDLWDRLGLSAPAVVGLSLGGWMAAELATRWPERVGKLVLVNPAGLYIPGAEVKEIFGRPLDELAADLFADQAHPVAQLMRQMASATQPGTEVPFELVKPVLAALSATAKLAWDPYLHDPKLHRRLGRVRSDTLVVHGERDGLIPRAHAEAYAAAIPRARLVDVPGAAHLVPLEKPRELAELVAAHLAG
ncbi:MAG TPA: alpha/beta hydrolase [Acidimicrobiales bacterium]|nr:alpha/beta hydrolase [Acidimicrobiales bacterium]